MADIAAKLKALADTTRNPASRMSLARDAAAIASAPDIEKSLEDLATLEQLAIERGEAARARAYRRQRMRLEAKLKDISTRRQAAREVDALVGKALSGVHRPVAATGPGGQKWVARKFGDYGPRSASEQLADGAVQQMSREEMLRRLAELREQTASLPMAGGAVQLAPTGEDPASRDALRRLAELNRLAMATGEKTAGPIHVARRTGRPRDGRMLVKQFGSAEAALREGDLDPKEKEMLIRWASRPKRMTRSEAYSRRHKREALGQVARQNPLAAYLLAGGQGGQGLDSLSPAMLMMLFGKNGANVAVAQAEVEQRRAAAEAVRQQAEAEARQAEADLAQAKARGAAEKEIAKYRARAEEARARAAEAQAEVQQEKLRLGDPQAEQASLDIRKQYWQMLDKMDADNWVELQTRAQALGIPAEVIAAYKAANPGKFKGVWDRFFEFLGRDEGRKGPERLNALPPVPAM